MRVAKVEDGWLEKGGREKRKEGQRWDKRGSRLVDH